MWMLNIDHQWMKQRYGMWMLNIDHHGVKQRYGMWMRVCEWEYDNERPG